MVFSDEDKIIITNVYQLLRQASADVAFLGVELIDGLGLCLVTAGLHYTSASSSSLCRTLSPPYSCHYRQCHHLSPICFHTRLYSSSSQMVHPSDCLHAFPYILAYRFLLLYSFWLNFYFQHARKIKLASFSQVISTTDIHRSCENDFMSCSKPPH